MRVPKPLLDAVKERARGRGVPYARLIRDLMEREIARPEKPRRRSPRGRPRGGTVALAGEKRLSISSVVA